MEHDPKQQLLDSIRAAEISTATSVIERWIDEHGYQCALTELVEPVLQLAGEMWDTGEGLNLAQGYIAARVIERAMAGLIGAIPSTPHADDAKGPVILGNVEDDFHFLGRKMVAAFLRAAGWQVVDLGNDVPAEKFVDEAIRVDARVIGVSAMTYTNAKNIGFVREEIDRRDLKGRVQLAVGGAVFVLRPELGPEVGGDGTARNAVLASDLFERLWTRSLEAELAATA